MAWYVVSSSSGRRHNADLCTQTLRIAELWQKVANYIGSGGRNIDRRAPWLPESTFAVLQRELLIFEERLPTVFKYNEANLTALSMIGGQVRLFGMLHLLFETAKLVLHRDYLPFLPPPNFRVRTVSLSLDRRLMLFRAGWRRTCRWRASVRRRGGASGMVANLICSFQRFGTTLLLS